MKKIILFIGFAGMLFMIAACVDEIALNVDTDKRTLVVDGFVTDSLGTHVLNLSQSSVIGVGNDNILTPVGGATVQLKDDANGCFSYYEKEEGLYELYNFKAERGKMYYIDIEIGANHYQSKPSMLRSSSEITEVGFTVEERSYTNNVGTFITEERIAMKIGSDVSQAAEAPYLRWRIHGEYQLQEGYQGALNPRLCYIKNTIDLNNISVFNTNELNGTALFDQEIIETTYDYRFADQYCFHISQLSISKEEYEYWENIKEITDIDGSLFDPPPGTVRGNIINVNDPDDIAVGYFSVSSVAFRRVFANGVSLNSYVAPKCILWGNWGRPTPFGCMNCLEVSGSTLVKPDYWQ